MIIFSFNIVEKIEEKVTFCPHQPYGGGNHFGPQAKYQAQFSDIPGLC